MTALQSPSVRIEMMHGFGLGSGFGVIKISWQWRMSFLTQVLHLFLHELEYEYVAAYRMLRVPKRHRCLFRIRRVGEIDLVQSQQVSARISVNSTRQFTWQMPSRESSIDAHEGVV